MLLYFPRIFDGCTSPPKSRPTLSISQVQIPKNQIEYAKFNQITGQQTNLYDVFCWGELWFTAAHLPTSFKGWIICKLIFQPCQTHRAECGWKRQTKLVTLSTFINLEDHEVTIQERIETIILNYRVTSCNSVQQVGTSKIWTCKMVQVHNIK